MSSGRFWDCGGRTSDPLGSTGTYRELCEHKQVGPVITIVYSYGCTWEVFHAIRRCKYLCFLDKLILRPTNDQNHLKYSTKKSVKLQSCLCVVLHCAATVLRPDDVWTRGGGSCGSWESQCLIIRLLVPFPWSACPRAIYWTPKCSWCCMSATTISVWIYELL